MLGGMSRRLVCLAVGAALAVPAVAAAEPPEVGRPWPWPTVKTWLEGSPVAADTAGKVVVHWFCQPRLEACTDDLARLFNMREQGKVYVIAYIAGGKRDAMRLDPIRGEVGAGAVSFGKPLARMFARLGLAAPTSIVVDVAGKVALVSSGGDPDTLDARDQKVRSLVAAIHEFTARGEVAPVSKLGQRFELKLSVELASWLTIDRSVEPVLTITVPPDVTCEATKLEGKQLQLEPRRMSATIGCQGTVKGAYEARGAFRFSYRAANKAVGVGQDDVRWKFRLDP